LSLIKLSKLTNVSEKNSRDYYCSIYSIIADFSPRYRILLPSLFARPLLRSKSKFSKTEANLSAD